MTLTDSPAIVALDATTVGADPSARYASYFCELDAWTEYWDLYHPETRGRYYFGGGEEEGLLHLIVPFRDTPPVMTSWKNKTLGVDDTFGDEVRKSPVAAAMREYDDLVTRIHVAHFGADVDEASRRDYLEAMLRFATDRLPPATDRLRRMEAVNPYDPRWRTAGTHTIDADMMWFVWAIQLEAMHVLDPGNAALRAVQLAGVALGASANFAWRRNCRTRAEYGANEESDRLIVARAMEWSTDCRAGLDEIRALYRIREWGHP